MTKSSISPPPNLQGFVASQKPVSLAVDPQGKDLVVGGLVKIVQHAQMIAPDKDGIRHSHVVWVSDTSERMAASVQKFCSLFPSKTEDPMGIDDDTYGLNFDDVACRISFRVYDGPVEASSLPKASFYVFDEFNGIDESLFGASFVCARRHPSMQSNGVGCATEGDEKIGYIWGMSTSLPSPNSYWDDFIKNRSEEIYVEDLT